MRFKSWDELYEYTESATNIAHELVRLRGELWVRKLLSNYDTETLVVVPLQGISKVNDIAFDMMKCNADFGFNLFELLRDGALGFYDTHTNDLMVGKKFILEGDWTEVARHERIHGISEYMKESGLPSHLHGVLFARGIVRSVVKYDSLFLRHLKAFERQNTDFVLVNEKVEGHFGTNFYYGVKRSDDRFKLTFSVKPYQGKGEPILSALLTNGKVGLEVFAVGSHFHGHRKVVAELKGLIQTIEASVENSSASIEMPELIHLTRAHMAAMSQRTSRFGTRLQHLQMTLEAGDLNSMISATKGIGASVNVAE